MRRSNGSKTAFTILATSVVAIAFLFLFAFDSMLSGASTPSTNVIASATVNSVCLMSISNTAIDFGLVSPTVSTATSNTVAIMDTGAMHRPTFSWQAGIGSSEATASTSQTLSGTDQRICRSRQYTYALHRASSLVDTLIQVPAPTLPRLQPPTTSTSESGYLAELLQESTPRI